MNPVAHNPIHSSRHSSDGTVLTVLLALAAVLSFSGFVIVQIEMAHAWGDHWGFSVPLLDLASGLAFAVGALALVSRSMARVAAYLLAGLYLILCLAEVPLLLQHSSHFGWYNAAFLILVGTGLLAALISLRKNATRFVPLAAPVFILAYYTVWHIDTLKIRSQFLGSHPREWMFGDLLTANLAGARWWHILVIVLLGLLLIRMVSFLRSSGTAKTPAGTAPRRPHQAGYLGASVIWLAASAFVVQHYCLIGLAPLPFRPSPHPSFEERLLLRVPAWRWYTTPRAGGFPYESFPGKMIAISPNGDKVAEIETSLRRGMRVVSGGMAGPWHEAVTQMRFTWPAGKLYYVAKGGGAWHAVFEGHEGPALDSPPFAPTFGSDGETLAYSGCRLGKCFAVFRNVTKPLLTSACISSFLSNGDPVYETSQGGRRHLMAGDRRVFEIPDQAKVFCHGALRQCGYISEHPGQWTLSGKTVFGVMPTKGVQQYVFLHGKAGPDFDEVEPYSFAFSPDGTTVAYVGRIARKYFLVVNDQVQAVEPRSAPIFSPGGRLAYAATDGHRQHVVVGAHAGPDFREVSGPFFSRDGEHLGYVASDGGKPFLVLDGRKVAELQGEYSNWNFNSSYSSYSGVGGIGGMVLDPACRTVAYRIREGTRECMVVGNQIRNCCDWISTPIFSSDGRALAYKALRSYKEFVVTNGREGPKHDWVSDPVFSPDGGKMAYAAEDSRDFWWKVVSLN